MSNEEKSFTEQAHEHALQHRGIWRVQDACPTCNGYGRIYYGSTSTWMGGIGGAAMTWDVCNKCWGSGDERHPGVNLKEVMPEYYRLKNEEYLRTTPHPDISLVIKAAIAGNWPFVYEFGRGKMRFSTRGRSSFEKKGYYSLEDTDVATRVVKRGMKKDAEFLKACIALVENYKPENKETS